jgi:hypothetical protein
MPTRTEHTHQVTQIELVLEASYTNFTHAFESLHCGITAPGPAFVHRRKNRT